MKIEYQPIGVIHSPFTKLDDMPIQPAGAAGIVGSVEVFAEYAPGLDDLDGFSHIILLYHFHQSAKFKLRVVPFMDNQKRGLFATRAPNRPNPVGMSVVRLLKIEERLVQIENVDILTGTPLLDIKPYVPEFDEQRDVRTGWLANAAKTVKEQKSDERFVLR
jgi:tRNA-Thr(GGU) m(6)t(6)A37 methyltransferase TsaA